MSTAMRSTLQTVPEILEVTKPNTTTQEVPATVSIKTPAKTSGEAVATKTTRPYNYASSTNKPITIKNQMMRLLRRSKSTATAHTEKSVNKTPPGHHAHHHYHHNHVVHPQHNRNGGGMVVNMVEGVPVVVGPGIGKSKKPLVESQLSEPRWQNIYRMFSYKRAVVVSLITELDYDLFERLRADHERELREMSQMDPGRDEERTR